MELPDITTIPVHHYRHAQHTVLEGQIAISTEYPVLITINGHPFITIACSGNNIADLVTGHLFAEGIITTRADIKNIDLDNEQMIAGVQVEPSEQVNATLSRSPSLVTCGGGSKRHLPYGNHVKASLPDVKAAIITRVMDEFLRQSSLHKKTHGVHSSALLDLHGNQVVFYDEIGRHNAIDKVIGFAINNNIDLHDKMILSTGRISSEIIMKIIISGVPVFISRASPTSYCVDLVKQYNLLCICRARQNDFVIINGSRHVIL